MRLAMFRPSLPSAASRSVILFAAVIATAGLAACSSTRQAGYQDPAYAGNPQMAQARQPAYEADPNDPIKDAPVEPRRNAVPDDPREPYSPNYGGPRDRPPVKVSDAPEARDLEPDRQVVHRLPAASRAYFRKVTATASAD